MRNSRLEHGKVYACLSLHTSYQAPVEGCWIPHPAIRSPKEENEESVIAYSCGADAVFLFEKMDRGPWTAVRASAAPGASLHLAVYGERVLQVPILGKLCERSVLLRKELDSLEPIELADPQSPATVQ